MEKEKSFSKRNGILLAKLFWPTVRKNCYSDWDFFFMKFEDEGQEFAKSWTIGSEEGTFNDFKMTSTKGGFFSERAEAFVISPNRWT